MVKVENYDSLKELKEKASKTKSNIRKKGNVYDFCTFCETDSCLVKHIFVEVTS